MAVAPKFKVHELPGKVKHEIVDYEPHQIKVGETVTSDGDIEEKFKTVRKRVMKTVEEPAGWLVVMTRGHSIRVRTHDELVRLGFAEPAPLVDTDSGEEVPQSEIGFLNQGIPLESLIGNYIPAKEDTGKRGAKA